MFSRFIGGLLLIVGTSIGGGMLALPVVNAASGFWLSSFFLVVCWLLMTLGAFFILEVNLYLTPGHNMPSMAYATLGPWGLVVTWFCYLLLMYVLLCAYISGGADVLSGLMAKANCSLTDLQSILLFTSVFGAVVYAGIRHVDGLNRALMFVKLTVYVLLVGLITPLVKLHHLQGMDLNAVPGSLMVLMTAFGFAIIVPNLRTYFNDDLARLKKVIWIGSLIPLFCYIAWDAVIMGCLPPTGLTPLVNNPHTTRSLSVLLANNLHNSFIFSLFNVFTSVCMLTAFLGVSLCFMSFLEDGLKCSQHGLKGLLLAGLTFIPPVLLVLYYPGAYLYALRYAGRICVILLLFLPALMALKGRGRYLAPFKVWGGRYCQWLVMISSLVLVFIY